MCPVSLDINVTKNATKKNYVKDGAVAVLLLVFVSLLCGGAVRRPLAGLY